MRLDAAGLGPWDTELREGRWATGKERFPLIPGTDGAGCVAAVGASVQRFSPGDRVFAYRFANPSGGFHAPFVAVDEAYVAFVPDQLDSVTAGALPTVGLTALQGIETHLGVREGDDVLILGATGGVGILAVQFACQAGARVLATASGADGAALVERLGAHASFDPRRDDPREAARAFAPEGLTAVLANAGGPALAQIAQILGPDARVAVPSGVRDLPAFAPGQLKEYSATASPETFERLTTAWKRLQIILPLAHVYELSQAHAAFSALERGGVRGKLAFRFPHPH
ncbi:NADP-dependent oxidoreductase [Deinococcus hopiensis]